MRWNPRQNYNGRYSLQSQAPLKVLYKCKNELLTRCISSEIVYFPRISLDTTTSPNPLCIFIESYEPVISKGSVSFS
jgi:hypothetical protein